MRIVSEVVERLRSLLCGHQESRELDEEIRFHIDSEAARLQESGMSPEEARRAAHVRFGGTERTKERAREARGVLWAQNALTDLRLAHRGLLRTPGQSLAAVVTFALGIGVATTMFGTIYGAFYRALPFDDAEHFVYVERVGPRGEELPMSYHDFVEWKDAARSFRDLGASYTVTAGLRAAAENMPLATALVTWNSLEVSGRGAGAGAYVSPARRPPRRTPGRSAEPPHVGGAVRGGSLRRRARRPARSRSGSAADAIRYRPAGVLMATGLARAMVIVLFETQPNDPSMYAITIGAILAMGVLASLYPALRAARTDPARSLQAG